jgi:hypothetical protein
MENRRNQLSLIVSAATQSSDQCKINPRDLAQLHGQIGDVVVVRGVEEEQKQRQALLRVWPDSKTPKGRE